MKAIKGAKIQTRNKANHIVVKATVKQQRGVPQVYTYTVQKAAGGHFVITELSNAFRFNDHDTKDAALGEIQEHIGTMVNIANPAPPVAEPTVVEPVGELPVCAQDAAELTTTPTTTDTTTTENTTETKIEGETEMNAAATSTRKTRKTAKTTKPVKTDKAEPVELTTAQMKAHERAVGKLAKENAKNEVKDNFKSALKKLPSCVRPYFLKTTHKTSNDLGLLVAAELDLYNDKETRGASVIKTPKHLFSCKRFLKVYTTIKAG
jgi:hypothetical protein